MPSPSTAKPPITRLQFVSFLFCPPLYVMLTLMVCEALLSAMTTYFVIQAGRDVTKGAYVIIDLLWILGVQCTAYVVGTVSWYFGERAGFHGFGRYMLQFARSNMSRTKLLHDKSAREQVEPFLTGTTFYNIFNFMYEIEGQLKLLLGLIFNALVLGLEIDAGLPVAYGLVFVILSAVQWTIRRRVAHVYLENQRQNNRLIAQGYTAWDNVFAGNRYNRRLWIAGFKSRLRDCLWAQIRAIMTREGLSALGGVLGLAIVFTMMTWVAVRAAGNTELLIALAATLPRQIEMTEDVHLLASGWNDVLAYWTRIGGVVANMYPEVDPHFDDRIKFDHLVLREGSAAEMCGSVAEALGLVLAKPTGRIQVRGGNGTGKSTLLAALKQEVKARAYYWPTTDRLAFRFAAAAGLDEPENIDLDEDELEELAKAPVRKLPGFSSGERQLKSLQEIVASTRAPIYLLDEWDANLDPTNRASADALVEELAHRARVVEISHRDRV